MTVGTDSETGLTAERLREVLSYNQQTGIFRWRVSIRRTRTGMIAGCLDAHGYWRICIDQRHYKAHRLAWLYVYGEWPSDELDHKDLCRSHNWISNLRVAGQAMNNANRKAYRNNKSGIKGIYSCQGRWRAMIRQNNKSMHLGCYDTPEEAHRAYCKAAAELFGEFANAG